MRTLRYGAGCLRVYLIEPLARWLRRVETRDVFVAPGEYGTQATPEFGHPFDVP